jgi:hypothetical protein
VADCHSRAEGDVCETKIAVARNTKQRKKEPRRLTDNRTESHEDSPWISVSVFREIRGLLLLLSGSRATG